MLSPSKQTKIRIPDYPLSTKLRLTNTLFEKRIPINQLILCHVEPVETDKDLNFSPPSTSSADNLLKSGIYHVNPNMSCWACRSKTKIWIFNRLVVWKFYLKKESFWKSKRLLSVELVQETDYTLWKSFEWQTKSHYSTYTLQVILPQTPQVGFHHHPERGKSFCFRFLIVCLVKPNSVVNVPKRICQTLENNLLPSPLPPHHQSFHPADWPCNGGHQTQLVCIHRPRGKTDRFYF